ncbi:MAG: hypothetical protein FJ014_04225 [Chloroflexi bacterium]|nr:hypothetical protein [Chloroflexota bacterium]
MKSRTIVILLATAAILALVWAAGSTVASPPREEPGDEKVTISGISVSGTVATKISYQGRLTDANGSPVADGTYTMQFRLYDARSGGTMLWDSGSQNVQVYDGLFNVELGVDPSHFNGQALWLETKVGAETLSPRRELLPVPYALSLVPGADVVGTVGGGSALAGANMSSAEGSMGVLGYALATNGETYGLYGKSDSSDGVGVFGLATAASGTTYGVKGQSDSTAGRGVLGYATAASGTTYGVKGQSDSPDGTGVYGYVTATSGETDGVWGKSESTAGTGVWGLATATSGTTYGVFGESKSTSGRGVVGIASASSGTTYGVRGVSYSPSGYGVYYVGGLGGTGTKSAIVPTQDYGWRKLYAVESPGNFFEDFGQGQLANGQATVTIDPIFAQTVNLTETYYVFLTPVGDTPVLLFITEKTPTTFTVRGVTLDGQPAKGAFDYRIVAKRLGYENLRLEPTEDPHLAVETRLEPAEELELAEKSELEAER